MNDTARNDPYLDLPLEGLQLIEASAGTGKTFTLATLVTRLVIERGLRVGQILAVTFTEAATQELRERLRQRLTLAAHLASGISSSEGNAEAALTRQLIERQLQHESPAALHARLQRAAREIDLAAVFTIHGFCARVLGDHALETGQTFIAAEMIGSDRELRDEVAADVWRAFGADATDAELLQRRWPGGPHALANELHALLNATQVLPPQPAPSPDPSSVLQQAFEALCVAYAAHSEDAPARLNDAIAAGVIDGRKARAASYTKAWLNLGHAISTRTLARTLDHLDKLTPERLRECAKAGREHQVPVSPLFNALGDWFAADLAREAWLAAQTIALVHRVRDAAAMRLTKLKRMRRVQTFDDLIDGVAAALDSGHGATLVQRLRQQYAVALVDEFQDTDPRQWAIFRRVFGATEGSSASFDSAQANGVQTRFLALIGDPKQAIYRFRGGDVHTYLAAAGDAQAAPPLMHNFRSRPAVLRAIETLYHRAGDAAFVDARIRFHPVIAGGKVRDGDFQHDGRPAPALTVRVLPAPESGAAWKADESRRYAAHACVEAMHRLLGDARKGRTRIGQNVVHPGDLAVLVRTHDEAALMQGLLTQAGIPAVAAGRQSLFASEQAFEVLALLEALVQPGDEMRLRGALATVLLGLDAAQIARFDDDDHLRGEWQLRALDWRERWERHGPLALISDRCADNAPRLLQLLDGERRLTNLLQLGEMLQEAATHALGLHGLVDWLHTRIAEADSFDETQQLRLESDAQRVQVMTLHKSKGLEYPLVFLPFAGIGKEHRVGRWCEIPGAEGRVLQLKSDAAEDESAWHEAVSTWQREERAEDARLLYVGLTRAEHALWLATGPLYRFDETPLTALLGDPATLRTDVAGDIVIDAGGLPPTTLPPLPAPRAEAVPEARHARRMLNRDWWVYSFTQLARESVGNDVDAASHSADEGAADEPEPGAGEPALTEQDAAFNDRRFSGSRFGNVLHTALERVDFTAWRDWRGMIPTAQDAPLRSALHSGGYTEADSEDGLPTLAALVGHTLNVVLPEGLRLCDLAETQRRSEMEFHFALQPTSIEALLATLHAHGVLRDRQAFGLRRRLEGLMTGKIDLVYMDEGSLDDGSRATRYYLLDYKSNRLPAYDPASLDAAMAESEYTLQALIYTVALHRWLRFRLGDSYDYERNFGGVRYVFCRGLDAANATSPGIHAHTPPRALVDALDALFAGGGA
ncbi:MAG TPA: exodeoxyribonuclease V subunit beta [Lysobacter sp.]|nr:exodeoxyribonuclease V subunit beta [Lysobacter sp.]